MGELSERIIGGYRRRVNAAHERITSEVKSELVQSISESYPPASEPGTPPHRRTGGYIESIEGQTTDESDVARSEIFSDSPLAGWLENGTEKMRPRPHFAPCFERWRDQYQQRISAAIDGN